LVSAFVAGSQTASQSTQLTTYFTMQSIEWTPAACLLAFQASLVVLTALCLIFGQTDGIYKFEPHTKEISSRAYELLLGGCLLGWGSANVGALIAGGAQIMCILQLMPMLAATYYHYVGGGKSNVVVNAVIMVLLAYFGFVPLPEVESIEWTPAAILMAVYGFLIAVTGILLFVGSADKLYENEPHTKAIMSRQGERQAGSCLFGWGVAIWGATIAGGATDMCILYLPGMIACSVYHYKEGGIKNVIVNVVFMVPAAYLGFVR
jgi:hypothetical protein